ncbi:MAG: amidohydrolase family protein [Clostridiales bacterium]|nr:amidohydrolase family protein [Clostridiales bacterium]
MSERKNEEIIDFRVRPLYKHYLEFDEKSIVETREKFGYDVTESVKKRDVASLVEEIKAANVTKAIVPGRQMYGTTNDELFELQDMYPDTFIIFPFVDITDTQRGLEAIDKYIINGRGKGASIETATYDVDTADPIYKKLEDNNIPAMITCSIWNRNPYIDETANHQIDRILTRFPNLKLIVVHAGWPWVEPLVALTDVHPNLYLLADFEPVRGVGKEAIEYGTRYMAKKQVLFGSSYPLGPIAQGIQSIKDWKLPKEIEDDVLYNTAARILGI